MSRSLNIAKYLVTLAIATAALLLSVLLSPLWLLLLLGPILGVPILRELGALEDADERQRLNSYRSSHLALYVTALAALVLILENDALRRELSTTELYTIILVAFAAKLIAAVIMNLPPRLASLVILSANGAWWLLFVLLSHGLSLTTLVESVIGFSYVAVALITLRFPRLGAYSMLAAGLLLMTHRINIYLANPSLSFLFQGFILFALGPLASAITVLISSDTPGSDDGLFAKTNIPESKK